ncbi:DUF4307 domain-containing protein [Actinotalea sp.]|uniref:DUF4307 domain-containing protein n=1 Tax=Actinotalea sp. TaxID=1872145 RepID=UPI00356245C3
MTEQSAAPRVPAGRYGPEPDVHARRRRVVALWVTGALGLGVVVWLGLGVASSPVSWKDVGFTVSGSEQVEIAFDVIRSDPAAPVQCRVQALNENYAQVGVRTVDVLPGDRQAQRERAVIATSELATTAVVDRCWLSED